jgi:hypothetical protein
MIHIIRSLLNLRAPAAIVSQAVFRLLPPLEIEPLARPLRQEQAA